ILHTISYVIPINLKPRKLMPRDLPHVKLNTQAQYDQPVVLHFNYGFGEEKDKQDPDPDYTMMAQSFGQDLTALIANVQHRRAERNPALAVPAHIEYVEMLFQSQFALNSFFQQWRNNFGLEAVQISEFGTKVLFAVVDRQLMRSFVRDIERFVAK